MLAARGFELIEEAADGDDALSAKAPACPDGIVLDINLPGRDGLAVAASLAFACSTLSRKASGCPAVIRVRAIRVAIARTSQGSGMQAWSTVPPVAGLVMSIVPLSAPMRSRRPFSPLVCDRGWAPPVPSSPTSMAHRSSLSSTRA
jgi:hypothetical protein